ncbi:MAG: HAD hydrolase family protein [Planctomycetota bacterium]
MRRFDAVICDIDGCLGPEATGPFDMGALSEVAEYNRLAWEVGDRPAITLCSGRPVTAVEMVSRMVGNVRLTAVAEMGAFLYLPETTEYELDPRITPGQRAAVDAARRWTEDTLVPEGAVVQPGKHASVSIFHPDHDRLHEEFVPRVRELTAERRWPLQVSATWAWINWDLEHVSKASGIDRLIERTGLHKDRLAGIGDTASDLAIRGHVARFGCPQNAKPELKQRADFVSTAEEARGVVEFLETLIGP